MNRRTFRPLNRLSLIGLFALVVANSGSWFVQRHTSLSEPVTDPFLGALFGVAIGTLLLGIRSQSRRSDSTCGQR